MKLLYASLIAIFLLVSISHADTFKSGANSTCFKRVDKFTLGACPDGTGGGGGGTGTMSMLFPNTGAGENQRVEGPSDTDIFTSAPIGDFSFSYWFKRNSAISNNLSGPLGSSTSTSLTDGWFFGRFNTNDACVFQVGSTSSDYNFTCTALWTADGPWHHVSASFTASTLVGVVYVNGVANTSGAIFSATRPLGGTISYGASTDFADNGSEFEGFIDDGAFWGGTVIDATDAACLYNSGAPIDPTTCVAGADWYIIFGDDAADDDTLVTGQVTDQTANGNDFVPQATDGTGFGFVVDSPP